MNRVTTMLFSALALAWLAGSAAAQPPQEPRGPLPKDGRGPPGLVPGQGEPGWQFRPPLHPLMMALDADADGELSAEEISHAAAALKKLDKDADGRLSREELRPQGVPPRMGFGGLPGDKADLSPPGGAGPCTGFPGPDGPPAGGPPGPDAPGNASGEFHLLPRYEMEQPPALPYCVVDTGQKSIFSDAGQLLKTPKPSEPFFGQDAQYQGRAPNYARSSDGLTVHDNNTGLTWQRSPEVNGDGVLNPYDKLTWTQAQARPAALNAAQFGGYSNWRLPTIKELYSLIDFQGVDPSPLVADAANLTPFIDTKYFEFVYGDPRFGERVIDSQYASSTVYVRETWRGFTKLFGVNFADGRIKGYDLTMPGGGEKSFYVLCVRGNANYGKNKFQDNGDGTIADEATGLVWAKDDSQKGMNWEESLAWVQARNRENYLGHSDWRLPNAKELQSIVDYTRCPDSTHSAAIDPVFTCTRITNEAGQEDFPCYWTGTTHGTSGGRAAVYISFGRSLGYMFGQWRDVHGAGAQRSDPKSGDPASFPQGRGPQGDAIRIDNFVRPVRSIDPGDVRLVEPDLTPLPMQHPPGVAGPAPKPGFPGGLDGRSREFHLIPPFAAEKMNLTPDQQRQIAELEQEVKVKLDKIVGP